MKAKVVSKEKNTARRQWYVKIEDGLGHVHHLIVPIVKDGALFDVESAISAKLRQLDEETELIARA